MDGRTLQFYCGFTLGPKPLRCEGAVWCEGGSGRCSPPIVLLFSSVFAVRSASVLSADLLPRTHMRRLWPHVGATNYKCAHRSAAERLHPCLPEQRHMP